MTPKQFGLELAAVLNPSVMMGDMIYQDELFDMQDKICALICKAANGNNQNTRGLANAFVEAHPRIFNVTRG